MKRPKIGVVVKKRLLGKGEVEVEISLPNPKEHQKFIQFLFEIRRKAR